MIRLDGIDAQRVHVAYTQAIEGMREDAIEMSRIFGDESLPVAERRNKVQARVQAMMARFDKVYELAKQVLEQHKIDLTG
jgi:hypothetical protein